MSGEKTYACHGLVFPVDSSLGYAAMLERIRQETDACFIVVCTQTPFELDIEKILRTVHQQEAEDARAKENTQTPIGKET